MLIFDTCVVSELMKPEPESRVSNWVSLQENNKIHITAVTEAELRYGVELLDKGKRRDQLENKMSEWLVFLGLPLFWWVIFVSNVFFMLKSKDVFITKHLQLPETE